MKRLLVALAVLVVLAVVVLIVVLVRRDPAPPPVTGPGVFRIVPSGLPNGGQRAAQVLSYRGKEFTISLGMVSGQGKDARASMRVTGPGKAQPLADYHEGQVLAFDGARLKVVGIYARGSDQDNRVDVQVLVP